MFIRGIIVAGAFITAVLLPPPALAQISDDVVKIGVLTDMNGPAATSTGQGSVTAAQMAVEDFGGTVLGKPVRVIVGDHQDKPDIGAATARRWYDTEQVDLIVDVPVSVATFCTASPTADTGTSTIRSTCSVSYHFRASAAPMSGLS